MTPYYTDAHVTIYHGDCLNLLDDLTADVLITDPPYGINWSRGENKARQSRSHNGIVNDTDTTYRDTVLDQWGTAKPAATFGSLYLKPPPQTRHVLVWQKPTDAGVVGSTNGFRRDIEGIYLSGDWPRRVAQWSSVLKSSITNIGNPSSPAGLTGHPHAKPTDLMRQLIDLAGFGVILDPFMGSGTTLRAAKDLNRKAIGIEIDESYCEIAAKRCAQEVLPL